MFERNGLKMYREMIGDVLRVTKCALKDNGETKWNVKVENETEV